MISLKRNSPCFGTALHRIGYYRILFHSLCTFILLPSVQQYTNMLVSFCGAIAEISVLLWLPIKDVWEPKRLQPEI